MAVSIRSLRDGRKGWSAVLYVGFDVEGIGKGLKEEIRTSVAYGIIDSASMVSDGPIGCLSFAFTHVHHMHSDLNGISCVISELIGAIAIDIGDSRQVASVGRAIPLACVRNGALRVVETVAVESAPQSVMESFRLHKRIKEIDKAGLRALNAVSEQDDGV